MKKFFYVALMALTVGFFASCGNNNGMGSSDFYKDGKQVDINYNEGTINGTKYDTQNEQCWKVTATQKLIVTVTVDEYIWGPEFEAVAFGEGLMWTYAQTGIKASYKYAPAPAFKDSESCLENNDDED